MEINSTLVLTKGKWYVCVTVPVELRQSFKGQKQIKRSTGTSDKKIAEKRLLEKAARCSRCKGNDITSTQIIYVGSSELAISSSHVPKDKRILKS